jgi:hypothetical protein
MTDLTSPVNRRTVAPSRTFRNHRLVFTLEPGDLLSVREEGTRRKFTVSLEWVALKIMKKVGGME